MIRFRKIRLEDCEFISEVRNSCAETYLHDSKKYSVDDTKKWFCTLKVPYYIVYKNDMKIGYFRLSNYSEGNNNLYIGMDIHERFRGKGYAFESYKIFIPYIFDKYHLNKISLEVLSTNIIAYNLYKKLGFVVEGLKRQDVLKNNVYIDSVIMSLLRKEFLKSNVFNKNENN